MVGDPLLPETQIGPVIDQRQLERVLEYIEIGKEEGATLVCGGGRYTDKGCEKGFYVEPTLFGDVKKLHAHRPGGDLWAGAVCAEVQN